MTNEFNIAHELQKTYDEAVMKYESRSLNKPDDWKKLVQIRDETTEKLKQANETYFDEYESRVQQVTKRLIDEAGELKNDHPLPIGTDKFDHETIKKQAHTEVQLQHKTVVQQITQHEASQLAKLQHEARQRDRLNGLAQDQFNQVKDRRTVQDRRQDHNRKR